MEFFWDIFCLELRTLATVPAGISNFKRFGEKEGERDSLGERETADAAINGESLGREEGETTREN